MQHRIRPGCKNRSWHLQRPYIPSFYSCLLKHRQPVYFKQQTSCWNNRHHNTGRIENYSNRIFAETVTAWYTKCNIQETRMDVISKCIGYEFFDGMVVIIWQVSLVERNGKVTHEILTTVATLVLSVIAVSQACSWQGWSPVTGFVHMDDIVLSRS